MLGTQPVTFTLPLSYAEHGSPHSYHRFGGCDCFNCHCVRQRRWSHRGHDPGELFEAVWSEFDQHYAFFEHGQIDWDALGALYRDSISRVTTDREAARVIGAMVGRLYDCHADLTTPFGTFGPPPIPYLHHFSPDLLRTRYFRSRFVRPRRDTSSSHHSRGTSATSTSGRSVVDIRRHFHCCARNGSAKTTCPF